MASPVYYENVGRPRYAEFDPGGDIWWFWEVLSRIIEISEGILRSVMSTEEMKTRIALLEAENQRLREKIAKLEIAIRQFASAIGEKI